MSLVVSPFFNDAYTWYNTNGNIVIGNLHVFLTILLKFVFPLSYIIHFSYMFYVIRPFRTPHINVLIRTKPIAEKVWVLILLTLRLLPPKAQGCKDIWKISKLCHVGINWIAFAEYFRKSTNMPGFQLIFHVLHHFVLAKLAAREQQKG